MSKIWGNNNTLVGRVPQVDNRLENGNSHKNVSFYLPGQNIGVLHDGLVAGRVGANLQHAPPLGKPGSVRLEKKPAKIIQAKRRR